MGMNNMRMLNNHSIALLVTVLAALFTLFTALSYGAADISLTDVFKSIFTSTEGSFNTRIIVELRMPRTLLAFLAGSGLAIAGLILQTVTRNPLADPYLFGISSGASLGVVILMAFVGISAGFALSAAALAGSLVAMSLLILIAGRQQSGQVESMLLAGVACHFYLAHLPVYYFTGAILRQLRLFYFGRSAVLHERSGQRCGYLLWLLYCVHLQCLVLGAN